MIFIKDFIARIDTRSIVVIGLLIGATTLAFLDKDFRPNYANLAGVGLGGYLGQLYPQKKHEQ